MNPLVSILSIFSFVSGFVVVVVLALHAWSVFGPGPNSSICLRISSSNACGLALAAIILSVSLISDQVVPKFIISS